jgi:uncharacterized NAD-dependent epimerase/dehydratase family protein
MEPDFSMLDRSQKLAVYMEGSVNDFSGKMGFGILRYSPNPVACVIDSETAGGDMREIARVPRSCPIVATIGEAAALGAEVFVLGIAPPGGMLPPSWFDVIEEAVARGLSVVNGLHDLLEPRYPNLAPGQWIWDIRTEPPGLGTATGAPAHLRNRRVLMIGTDMSVGKMTAGLELYRAARERGVRAEFVATGQIGITLIGRGVPLDAIRVDFACHAIEREVLRVQDAELVFVEGQGALIHPGSSANLPLLRGSCPTELVLCHRAGQNVLRRVPEIAIPPLGEYCRLYEDVASAGGAFPRPRTVGVALNTFHIESDDQADRAAKQVEDELGLPCVDPVRHGPERLLDALLGPAPTIQPALESLPERSIS